MSPMMTSLFLFPALFLLLRHASTTSINYPVDGRVTPCWENTSLASLPFCNSKLSAEVRAADLVARFTLDEKVAQLGSSGGDAFGGGNSVPRLGLNLYTYHNEGLHGVRTACQDLPHVNTTEFPQVVGMAATGNPDLIFQMGETMANEARALNNMVNGTVFAKGAGLNYWGPTMNIGRDPRWGRFQESVSEDPWLNAAYAVAMVRGLQGSSDGSNYTKIAACCKHFYAYSLESSDGFTRHNFDAKVSSRDLAETFLPAFKACAAAGAEQVMCSYNSVNGVPTCLDEHAQQDILRGDFGFDGMIVSDCDSIADAWEPASHGFAANVSDATAKGILAGTDMDCGNTYREGGKAAVSSGALPVSALDAAVTRSLAMRFRLGEFDPPSSVPYRNSERFGPTMLDSEEARGVALRAAEESIVLLKNSPTKAARTPLLPLSVPCSGCGKAPLVVGVIGPTADSLWAPDDKNDYCPASKISPLAGLQAYAHDLPMLRVKSCPSCCDTQIHHKGAPNCSTTRAALFAKTVDVVILCLGGNLGGEAIDWDAVLPSEQAALAAAVVAANPHSVAVLVHGNPMAIDSLVKAFDAIVETFEGGQSAGTALAAMLLGRSAISPSGVLPWTVYPENYTSMLAMSDMSMRAGSGRTYRFFTGAPTFPFGHGLTYTTFSFEWAALPAAAQTVVSMTSGLLFRIKVTNTGNLAGAKVVQAYVHTESTADSPQKQLFGVQKIVLKPSESAVVTIDSNALPGYCSFCSVNKEGISAVRPGAFTVTIGTGGNDDSSLLLKHIIIASEDILQI